MIRYLVRLGKQSRYISSIRSAKEHKFIHEEAIASELAALFFYERGLRSKSQSFFMHSVKCYEKWGALAVARRVESDMVRRFGTDKPEIPEPFDDSAAYMSASESESPKKRQHEHQ